MRKRTVGVQSEEGIVAVVTPISKLPKDAMEVVQGVVAGYTDEGRLLFQGDLGELSQERRETLGYQLIELGMQILGNKLRIH